MPDGENGNFYYLAGCTNISQEVAFLIPYIVDRLETLIALYNNIILRK